MNCIKILLLYFFIFVIGTSKALTIQRDTSLTNKHSFSESEWKKATEGIDYSKELKPPPPKPPAQSSNLQLPEIGSFIKIILYIAIIAVLVFLLMKVLSGNLYLKNKKLINVAEFSEENVIEDIHTPDLEKLYNEAVSKGNLRQAIRLYYLIALRELSSLQFIHWKKDKTNGEYLFEMMNNPSYSDFSEVTLLFERIWYGDFELNELRFQSLNTKFSAFISEIKNQNNPVDANHN